MCELSQGPEGDFADTWRNGQLERAKVGLSQKGKFIRPEGAKRTKHNSSLQMLAEEASEVPGTFRNNSEGPRGPRGT